AHEIVKIDFFDLDSVTEGVKGAYIVFAYTNFVSAKCLYCHRLRESRGGPLKSRFGKARISPMPQSRL
ncbi:hypothetical protein M433DRAFT_534651, partial [Acidomyces richmondensis BFW]